MTGESDAKDFSDFKPLPVDGPSMAFGAMGDGFKQLAPMYVRYHQTEGIPSEFGGGHTLWNEVVSAWFFSGIPRACEWIPKVGIDKTAALRHVGAILASFEPDHGSKEEIAAYLLSLWFDDFVPSGDMKPHQVERINARRRAQKSAQPILGKPSFKSLENTPDAHP